MQFVVDCKGRKGKSEKKRREATEQNNISIELLTYLLTSELSYLQKTTSPNREGGPNK